MAIVTLNNRATNRSDTASAGQVFTATSATAADFQAGGGGKVLQVLNDTATSAVATTAGTGTFVDTGLSQAITPSATSSKILCIASIFHIRKNGDTSLNFRLIRGSTNIITPMGNYDTGDSQQLTETFNFQFLDSPNTTNATTYKIQYSSGNANLGADTCPAQFTLMEIGA